MPARTVFWIRIGLLILITLVGLDALYWLLFFLWRSAAEPARHALWNSHICIWLAVSVAALVVWSALVVWMLRDRRKQREK